MILCSPVIGSGFWLSLQAIERGDSIDNRCYRYIIDGLIGADLKYIQPEYQKWRKNFINHIYDKNKHLTKYLCENVSIPTLASVLALLLIIILNIVCIYLTCRNFLSNSGILNLNMSINVPITVSFSSANAYT